MATTSIDNAQKGLAYFPDYGIYTTWYLENRDKKAYAVWQQLVRDLDRTCAQLGFKTVVIAGIGFELLEAWSEFFGGQLPEGMGGKEKLRQHKLFLGNTGGDLWFHIKSDNPEHAEKLLQLIEGMLQPLLSKNPGEQPLIVPAEKRNKGKVLGGRFTDGLENPADIQDLSDRVVIGDYDPKHSGGAFLITQKFKHDWDKLNNMSELDKENMIGRDKKDRIIPMHDESSHIKRVRQIDHEKVNMRLVRQALPYGHKTENKANEKGIFFAGYAQSTHILDTILDGIAGPKKGFVQDQLFSVTRGVAGSYWYIPSLSECKLADTPGSNQEVTVNPYFDIRSDNGYLFYNAVDYQNKIRRSKLTEDCPISERIMVIINKQFSRWQDTWYKKRETPPLGNLKDYLSPKDQHLMNASVTLRKGKATQISLSKVLISTEYSSRANLMYIDPSEIVVGNMPQLSLGIGSQVMEYLNEDERLEGFFSMLNEYSSTGHNIPDYPLLIEQGIDTISAAFAAKLKTAKGDQKDFYQSVVWALDGLSKFIEAYAVLAEKMAKKTKDYAPDDIANLKDVAVRMRKLAHHGAESFIEGLQLVFITNCALHQTGEPMSIGRLDQVLIGLLEKDLKNKVLTPEQAQEALDSFWLKMDETVLYNYNHLNDYLTYGTGAVFYSAGNFPQGAAINQWVQQVTVGGYKANGNAEPEDASNELTLMCLRSARRLPLNAPCLSLRVHKKMEPKLFEEAAKAVLSGGAHPIMLNDDKLVDAIRDCGPLSLADARDYACDGCYEVIIPGKTEWAFSYTVVPPMIEYALNQGCNVQNAGPVNLRGLKSSWNSPPAAEIQSFDQFLDIFYTHWRWQMNSFFNTLMNSYGSIYNYSPSPLFSAFLSDSLATGRDLTNGGAKYHIVAPMMCGLVNAINSLFSIKQLVFNEQTARCTLPQLLLALQCNWGNNMTAPFYTELEGDIRKAEDAQAFKELREYALQFPKFGIGYNEELTALAETVTAKLVEIIHDCYQNPIPSIKTAYENLQKKYGTPDRPFAFVVTPGVGTFEDNLGVGMGIGASPDGRLSGQPIGDDCSAAPWPVDLPFNDQQSNAFESLKSWNIPAINHGIANAAPIDLNIREDFPLDQLTQLITDFSHGKLGSNMITVTCANPETFDGAMTLPEKYDLLRVRMGGWSEFYVAMFGEHQQYIKRRPYYTYK
jgi:Dyp-type peroxidase family